MWKYIKYKTVSPAQMMTVWWVIVENKQQPSLLKPLSYTPVPLMDNSWCFQKKKPWNTQVQFEICCWVNESYGLYNSIFCSVCVCLIDRCLNLYISSVGCWLFDPPPTSPPWGGMWCHRFDVGDISRAITDCRQCMNDIAVSNIVQN